MLINEFYKPKISKSATYAITNHLFNNPLNIPYLKNQLEKFGWKLEGSGVYSSVWSNPKKSYILKINKIPDPGFDHYVSVIKGSRNPHFPKISDRRQIFITGRSYYAYLIEKLEEFPNRATAEDYASMFNFVINLNMEEKPLESLIEEYGAIPEIFKKQPKLIKALRIVSYESKPFFRIDLHDENFMQRKDGTIVITDPYIGGYNETRRIFKNENTSQIF